MSTPTSPLQHFPRENRVRHWMTMRVSASEDVSLPICVLHIVNAEEEEELDVQVNRLDTTITRYKMEIGPDKTKVITNNPKTFKERSR